MRTRLSLPITAALASFLLASPVLSENFKPITSEAELISAIGGKTLVFSKETTIRFKRNGKMTGTLGGQKYRANWAWRDGFLCSTRLTHDKSTSCNLIEIDGNKLRSTRNRGKGQSGVATLK